MVFTESIPTDLELDALELYVDDQMYCANDVLVLIREVRRLRFTCRAVFKLIGKFADQIDPIAAAAAEQRTQQTRRKGK